MASDDPYRVSWIKERFGDRENKEHVKSYRSFRLEGNTYQVGDAVYLNASNGPSYIARITDLNENTRTKEKRMLVRWFCRPCEVPPDLPDVDYHGKEIFLSWRRGSRNFVDPASTLGKCNLLCTWDRAPPSQEEIHECEYFFWRAFDLVELKVRISDEIKDKLGPVDRIGRRDPPAGTAVMAQKISEAQRVAPEGSGRDGTRVSMENGRRESIHGVIARNSATAASRPHSPPTAAVSEVSKRPPSDIHGNGTNPPAQLSKEERFRAFLRRQQKAPLPNTQAVIFPKLRVDGVSGPSSGVSQHNSTPSTSASGGDANVISLKSSNNGIMQARVQQGNEHSSERVMASSNVKGSDSVSSLSQKAGSGEGRSPLWRGSIGEVKNCAKVHPKSAAEMANVANVLKRGRSPSATESADQPDTKRIMTAYPPRDHQRDGRRGPEFNGPTVPGPPLHPDIREPLQTSDEVEPYVRPKKIFRSSWQRILTTGLTKSKVFLLHGLDPMWSSCEVEEMLQQLMRAPCDVRMIPPKCFTSHISGKAIVVFETELTAQEFYRNFKDHLLILEGRPLSMSRLTKNCDKVNRFHGFFDLRRMNLPRECRRLLAENAGSHFAQPNSIEFESGVAFRAVQDRHAEAWNLSNQAYLDGLEDLVGKESEVTKQAATTLPGSAPILVREETHGCCPNSAAVQTTAPISGLPRMHIPGSAGVPISSTI